MSEDAKFIRAGHCFYAVDQIRKVSIGPPDDETPGVPASVKLLYVDGTREKVEGKAAESIYRWCQDNSTDPLGQRSESDARFKEQLDAVYGDGSKEAGDPDS